MCLLECQRFGKYAYLFATAWIQSFPEPAFAAAVSPQPFFASSGWAPRLWFRHRCPILLSWVNHEIHIAFVSTFGWLSHVPPDTSHKSLLQRFEHLPLDLPILLDAPGDTHGTRLKH